MPVNLPANFPNASKGDIYTLAPSFIPNDLFTGSEKGGWWDTSVSSSLSVNTDGTGGVPAIDATVGRWMDQSGHANHFIGVAGSLPIWSSEGIDTFPSSVRKYMDLTLPANITSTTLSCFAVVTVDSISNSADQDRLLSFATAAGVNDFDNNNGAALFSLIPTTTLKAHRNSAVRGTATNVSIGAINYFEVRFDGSNLNIRCNATDGTGSAQSAAFAAGFFRIGAMTVLTAHTEHFDGKVKELIIVDRALTTDELTGVRNYLNTKWTIY